MTRAGTKQFLLRVSIVGALLIVPIVFLAHSRSSPIGPRPPITPPPLRGSPPRADSPAEWLRTIAALVQAVGLIAAGVWAVYVYGASRRGRTAIGIEASARSAQVGSQSLLLVKMRIRNTSAALFCHESATALLIDASNLDSNGKPLLAPFAEQDPLLPVYGTISSDPKDVAVGRLFQDLGHATTLEPGESVDTELAFPITTPELLAMRVTVKGYERKPGGTPYEWGAFFYIDPRNLPATLVSGFPAAPPTKYNWDLEGREDEAKQANGRPGARST